MPLMSAPVVAWLGVHCTQVTTTCGALQLAPLRAACCGQGGDQRPAAYLLQVSLHASRCSAWHAALLAGSRTLTLSMRIFLRRAPAPRQRLTSPSLQGRAGAAHISEPAVSLGG
jgi:hypothetical protein